MMVLEVNNKIAENDLEHNKQKITAFIRENTGIEEVVLQIKCAEIQTKKKIYSHAETYEHFKTKSPAIEELVKAFDCEFEY